MSFPFNNKITTIYMEKDRKKIVAFCLDGVLSNQIILALIIVHAFNLVETTLLNIYYVIGNLLVFCHSYVADFNKKGRLEA